MRSVWSRDQAGFHEFLLLFYRKQGRASRLQGRGKEN